MFLWMKAVNQFRLRIGCLPVNNFYYSSVNKYSTPAGGSLGKTKKSKQTATVLEKKILPVETDANKLVKYVCGSNILIEGSDVEVKPDEEYPDWLWKLHIGKPKTLDELDPETLAYWRKVRAIGMKKKNRIKSLRKF